MSNPRQDEAAGETSAPVEFRGETFMVPTDYDDIEVEFFEALEDGKTVSIVRGALGAKQWATVKGMDLKMRDLGELSHLIAVAMGFATPGESPASSD